MLMPQQTGSGVNEHLRVSVGIGQVALVGKQDTHNELARTRFRISCLPLRKSDLCWLLVQMCKTRFTPENSYPALENTPKRSDRRTPTQTLNSLFLGLGFVLFIALLARLDAREVVQQLAGIGWMFVPAFSAYVCAQLLSTMTWKSCIQPGPSVASYWVLLKVYWAGHAVNAITPGGGLGEVLKATLLRDKMDGKPLLASLILYNVVNTATVAVASVVGAAICVLWLEVPLVATLPLLIATVAIAFGLFVLFWGVRRGALSSTLAFIQRLPFVSFRDPEAIIGKARQVDELMGNFFRERPYDVLRAVLFASAVRVVQVVELWCYLEPLMPGGNVILIAILAQTASTLTVWVTAFVPSQVGTLEGGNAAIFKLAALDPVLGVTTVIARRVRTILGVGIGLLLGGRVSWEIRRTARETRRS